MEVKALVAALKLAYSKRSLDCAAGLQQPATQVEIDAVSEALRLPVPFELRELWDTHGEQTLVGAGITGLFGWHRLLSPTQAIENNLLYCETCIIDRTTFPPLSGQWGSWVPELIPFATFNDEDLCIHALSAEVWSFRPAGGLRLHRSSIAAILTELIDLVCTEQEPRLE